MRRDLPCGALLFTFTLVGLASASRPSLLHHLEVDEPPAAPPVAPPLPPPPVAPPVVNASTLATLSFDASDLEKMQHRASSWQWQVRAEAVKSPDLEALIKKQPAEGLDIFEKLLTDQDSLVRKEASRSGPWTTVLEANLTKGLEFCKLLFNASSSSVRAAGVASSPCWTSLVKKEPTEALHFFQQLLTDEKWNVRFAVAQCPMWKFLMESDPTEGLRCFRQLLSDEAQNVRETAAKSKIAWEALLKQHPKEGLGMFKELFYKQQWVAVAASPAWSFFVEENRTEAVRLFHLLSTDDDRKIRLETVKSPAWKPLLKTNVSEKVAFLDLFERLVKVDARDVRIAALSSPAWKAFLQQNLTRGIHLFNFLPRGNSRKADDLALQAATASDRQGHSLTGDSGETDGFWPSLTSMSKEEMQKILKALPSEELVQLAKELDLMAHMGDVEFAELVEQLPVTQSLVDMLQRSDDVKFLGQMAKYPMTLSSKRLVDLAEESENNTQMYLHEMTMAQEALILRRDVLAKVVDDNNKKHAMVVVFLVLVILMGTLAVFLFLLWYFYPNICQWRDEKNLAATAKRAIKEAESYTVSVSQTPEPPAHLLVFHQYKEVYGNPYILYKYKCLEPVLRNAFRISSLTLEKGLETWDFSAVENSSLDFGQVLASENYQMARNFLDTHEATDLARLMDVCDGIQDACCKYVSDLEELQDPVDKCMKMYSQAFQAKRAYFDPMMQRIGKQSHAEVHLCGEKGMLRLAEKNALRPQAGLIWDCVRAMLCGHSLAELIEVLKMLKEEQDEMRIRIVHINNRFQRPTSDNWQDIAVYIMFTDKRFNGIVAEIQLTHETFLAVRTKFKAHDAYDGIRFAAEALKVKRQVNIRGLPDSQK